MRLNNPVDDTRFRPAEASDALCLSVLAMQVFLDNYATDGIRPLIAREVTVNLSEAAFDEQLAQPDARFIVAERHEHLIGFAHLTLNVPEPQVPWPLPAELNRLYVQERFTGRGVGAELLSRAEVLAANEGAPAMWLTAWNGNARALAFYPRRGYVIHGTAFHVFEEERHENTLFARRLSTT